MEVFEVMIMIEVWITGKIRIKINLPVLVADLKKFMHSMHSL